MSVSFISLISHFRPEDVQGRFGGELTVLIMHQGAIHWNEYDGIESLLWHVVCLGYERRFLFCCPHLALIREQFWSLRQHSDGTMQCFAWQRDQREERKEVCTFLAAYSAESIE